MSVLHSSLGPDLVHDVSPNKLKSRREFCHIPLAQSFAMVAGNKAGFTLTDGLF